MPNARRDEGMRTFTEWCEDGGGDVEWPRDDRAICRTPDSEMMVRLHRGNYQVSLEQENPGINMVGSDPMGSTFFYLDDVLRYDEETVRNDLLVPSADESTIEVFTDPDVLAFRDMDTEGVDRLAFEIG